MAKTVFCHNPLCKNPPFRRGVCKSCHNHLDRLIRKRKKQAEEQKNPSLLITWAMLEKSKKVLPLQRPIQKKFEWFLEEENTTKKPRAIPPPTPSPNKPKETSYPPPLIAPFDFTKNN